MIYSSIDLLKPPQPNGEKPMKPEHILALLQNITDQPGTTNIDPNVLKALKEIAEKFKRGEIEENEALQLVLKLLFP